MPGLMDLFSNKLFLQYLSGVGADISAGGRGVQAMNKITQENIQGQNMMQVFQKMLAGKGGEGSKMSVDGKGVKMQFDPKSFEGLFQIDKLQGEWDMGGANKDNWAAPTPAPGPGNAPVPEELNLPGGGGGGMLAKLLNPSVDLSGITASDLAGLSPTDISNALSGALNVRKLDQKKVTDLVDMAYKSAMGTEALARAGEVAKGKALDQLYPIPHYASGPMKLREWKELPADEKAYSAYSYATIRRNEIPMTKEQWEAQAPTDKIKTLRQMQADPLYGTDQSLVELEKSLRQQPDKPAKVTWSTATKELTKRYRIDPTGQFAVTPEIKWAHIEAQHILTELKDQGVEPLKAVNQAYDRAGAKQDKMHRRYRIYLEAAQQIKNRRDRDAKIEEIKSKFYETYGYIPVAEVIR